MKRNATWIKMRRSEMKLKCMDCEQTRNKIKMHVKGPSVLLMLESLWLWRAASHGGRRYQFCQFPQTNRGEMLCKEPYCKTQQTKPIIAWKQHNRDNKYRQQHTQAHQWILSMEFETKYSCSSIMRSRFACIKAEYVTRKE
jgi:hypothetical protein